MLSCRSCARVVSTSVVKVFSTSALRAGGGGREGGGRREGGRGGGMGGRYGGQYVCRVVADLLLAAAVCGALGQWHSDEMADDGDDGRPQGSSKEQLVAMGHCGASGRPVT
jgi:hypothetical protein